MPMPMRYRCLNCGERFETSILTADEVRDAKRMDQPLGQVHCPRCNRLEIRKGWD